MLRFTFPKERLAVLRLSVDVPAFSCNPKLLATVPAVAVRVAVWFDVTAETAAVKVAVVAPEDTVTDVGTLTEALLLVSATASPPDGAAAVRLTVHASLPDPVMEPLVQETALKDPACPVPLRVTAAVPLLEELLVTASDPLAAPVVVGSKVTVNVTLCPGFKVTGKLAPETLNPGPVTVAALIVTDAVPEEVRLTD